MLRRMLPRALMGALVFLWLAMAGAAGEIYYQKVDVANRSDRPCSSIRLISCDAYLHLDEYGSQLKTADCVYFSGDKQPSLDAPGDAFLFDAWPDEQNPMALDACEIWELPAGGPGGEGSMVLLALHWQSADGKVNYVSDLAVSVDSEGGWCYDRMELHDGIHMEHEGNLWTVAMGDIKSAAWKAEMEVGDKPTNEDIQRVMASYGRVSIRLEDGEQLEEDRYYTWSRGYSGDFDATCGLYQTLDDVHAPYEDQLSYRLGRALYSTRTHQQVGTVYTRVTVYDYLMVVCEVEDIVWLQGDAEDHSGWHLRVLRESDDVIPPDAPLHMAAVVEDENGEIQTAYSEGITWTLADPKTGTLAPFTKADNWLGAVTTGYSRMKLTPLIDAGQVTLTVRHDGLGLQEKLTLQVYSDPFQYRYNDTELIASVVGYTGDRSEGVVIPSTTQRNGKTYRVEAIDESAFEGMGIPWVSFPDSLEWICKDAFRNCDRLTSVNLTHVQGVEAGAFSSCDSLKEVFVGRSMKTLEDGVFADCSSLTTFHCDTKNENFRVDEESGALEQVLSSARAGNYIWREVRLACVPAGRNHRDLTLPYEVTEISPSAFSGCTGLGDVTIANPDTSLANVRFDGAVPNLRLLVYQDSQAEKDAIARGLNHARIFDWDSDRVKFLNTEDDYKKFLAKSIAYPISRGKLNQLVRGMSPVVRLYIQARTFEKWTGSCAGMCRIALIHRYIRLNNDTTQQQSLRESLSSDNNYEIPYPKNDSSVMEYVNYYHLMQYYPNKQDKRLHELALRPTRVNDGDFDELVNALTHGLPVYVSLGNHVVVLEQIKSVSDNKAYVQIYDPNYSKKREGFLNLEEIGFHYNDRNETIAPLYYQLEELDARNFFTGQDNSTMKTSYDDEEYTLLLVQQEVLKREINSDNLDDFLRFYDEQQNVYIVNPKKIPNISEADDAAESAAFLLDRPLPEQVTMAFTQGMAVSLLDARYPFTLEAECAGRVTVDYAARSLSVQADAPGTLQLTLAPEEGDAPGGEFVEITATDASRLTAAWSAQGLTLSSDSPELLDVVCLDGENAVETQVRAAGGTVGAGGITTAASGKTPTATPPSGTAVSKAGPTATPPSGSTAHQAVPEAPGTQPYWLLLLLPAGGALILLIMRARRRTDAHKPADHRPTGMQQASLTEKPAPQRPASPRSTGMQQASLTEKPAQQRPAPSRPTGMQQASLTEPAAPQRPAPPHRSAGLKQAAFAEQPAIQPSDTLPETPGNPPEPPREDG